VFYIAVNGRQVKYNLKIFIAVMRDRRRTESPAGVARQYVEA
jgi:hypothetical protein